MAGLAVELKPQDLVVLYKQVAQASQAWTYASLGEALGMRPSQVHRSVKRAVASGLALEKAAARWRRYSWRCMNLRSTACVTLFLRSSGR